MFKRKSLAPRHVAAFNALIISLAILIFTFSATKNWVTGLVSFGVMYFSIYFLLRFTIEKFVYRKIKLIYKFINQTKASKKEETYFKYVLPRKSIRQVSDDVEDWAREHTVELELLRKNETFRKEFLQNLSHEFKTPVFSIQGYIDILLQGGSDDAAMNEKYLRKAAANVERLVNLLKDLDEISSLERGELKLVRQYFVMQDLIREVFDALSWKAEKKEISFSFKKGCESPVTVFADKERIRQVLTNLVDNSLKYGKQGGAVVASVYDTDGKSILTEISDDGMGIPERQLNRVFERFYRTAEGRARDGSGTGLGLSICKHIVEAHGHSIHARSKEGVGTTVGFTVDARKAERRHS